LNTHPWFLIDMIVVGPEWLMLALSGDEMRRGEGKVERNGEDGENGKEGRREKGEGRGEMGEVKGCIYLTSSVTRPRR
jgi:hypothetical protein